MVGNLEINMDKSLDKPKKPSNIDITTEIRTQLANLESDITKRNSYMDTRDSYIYEEGLWSRIEIDDGNDRTLYNLLPRVVDIHSSQLMGRGFNVFSTYDKEDLSAFDSQPDEKRLAVIRNKKAKANADARKRAIDAMIEDNGGMALFKEGARLGSAFGTTVYKAWPDKENKRYNIQLIESPQNFRAAWSDTNFRERDFDAYVYQISYAKARRDYGDKLGPDEDFDLTSTTNPLGRGSNNKTSDPLNQNASTPEIDETERKMVTVIDTTGYYEGYKAEKDGGSYKVVACKPGDETRMSLLIVGGHVCQIIGDEDLLPDYYIINNRTKPRRAWGESDIPQSAMEINETLIQVMSDQITLGNKTLFPLLLAKGFTAGAIPKKKPRKMQVVPATQEQSIEAVDLRLGAVTVYENMVGQLLDYFVRVTGVGRVLFDDPTVNANSNQALMTTLKSVIDIVEDKQSRWTPVLIEMFTTGLRKMAKFMPELAEAVDEPNWALRVDWPSVLRKEDAPYQQMLLNLFNANAISWGTYLEMGGVVPDAAEEQDRLRDEMMDPTGAAVNSRQLALLAQPVIAPMPMMPDQMGGMGEGMEDAPLPTLTPDQNTGQSASMPGSGAPAVSPEAASAMMMQNQGA